MKIIIMAILILLIAVIILIKINRKQSEKNKELKENLEVLEKIYEKTKKINTGDRATDFNNSLELLNQYSNRKD